MHDAIVRTMVIKSRGSIESTGLLIVDNLNQPIWMNSKCTMNDTWGMAVMDMLEMY